jgi:hypothetical protein
MRRLDMYPDCNAQSLDIYIQSVLQGAFILAKAKHKSRGRCCNHRPPAALSGIAIQSTVSHFFPMNGTSAASLIFEENPMNRNGFAAVVFLILMVSSISGAARHALAQDIKTQYQSMAPLDQYLMVDRTAEIALARSAAPKSISGEATVLILDKSGYQTAVEGKNGFTCLVERAWMSPFDNPQFWNPKMRGPICYNPAAVRTILPYTINRTKLVLTGLSKEQMRESITAAIAKNELPMPEAGAMSYMMSKEGNLGDSVGHWHPHLMFHVPKTDDASWGADLEGSPVLYNNENRDVPEPETIFMVAVLQWSDGTAASHDASH